MSDNILSWVMELKPRILEFVWSLKERERPGYYRYSFSGDILGPERPWGLGNAVFAAKILYMLDSLSEEDREGLSGSITSFQDSTGCISDPLIEKLSRFRRLKYAVKGADVAKLSNESVRRAETRQAFAALRCLGRKPKKPYENIPHAKEDINRYIDKLDWSNPWAAASHVSHLVFFLRNNHDMFGLYGAYIEDIIADVFEKMDTYRRSDGAWYARGKEVSMTQKVNGAMKMMTAYEASGGQTFSGPEKLIDLCLAAVSCGNACNNFNVVCVLYHCSRKLTHKGTEIRNYCIQKLRDYKKHYWPEYGGFSFYEKNANSIYYGAKISRGLAEPDIHGTVLFLWAVVLVLKILEIGEDLRMRPPIT